MPTVHWGLLVESNLCLLQTFSELCASGNWVSSSNWPSTPSSIQGCTGIGKKYKGSIFFLIRPFQVGSEQAPFCLVQTEPNMDVCRVNRAIYSNFVFLALSFTEGACSKVPKIVRTFGNLWRSNLPLVHPEIWQASEFNLNLYYTHFQLFLSQCSTIFLGSPYWASADSTFLFQHIFFLSQIISHTLNVSRCSPLNTSCTVINIYEADNLLKL